MYMYYNYGEEEYIQCSAAHLYILSFTHSLVALHAYYLIWLDTYYDII